VGVDEGMTGCVLHFEIFESLKENDSRTYTAMIDSELLHSFQKSFDANSSSFWFRFFGEVEFHASRLDTLTDVTLHLALQDESEIDRELAASILSRLSHRSVWRQHVAMLASPNIDAIYITSENFKVDEVPRALSEDEAKRLMMIRGAFNDMLDPSDSDDATQADLATKIVMDILIGEFEAEDHGAMATLVGVWLGDRITELTGYQWHCIDEKKSVTFCIHNPHRKISCFPFDAMNKRLNAREAFQPHLLAATFAESLSGTGSRS